MTAEIKTCQIDGCTGAVHCRSLCQKHYKRWRKYGDHTVTLRPELELSTLERLLAKTDCAGSCWVWTGLRDRWGYGRMSVASRPVRTHRVAWELAHGAIPPGLVVRHSCDNPPCVNIDHLLLGTVAQNNADMVERGRMYNGRRGITHCPQGHPYDAENTAPQGNGGRRCRTCGRAANRAYRQRKAVAA